MKKLEFEIVRPNLYIINAEKGKDIYFALRGKENEEIGKGRNIYGLFKSVHDIVEKYIGTLKVKKSDFEILKNGKAPEEETKEQVSLRDYLNIAEKRKNFLELPIPEKDIFNTGYLINAKTLSEEDRKNGVDFNTYLHLCEYCDKDKIFPKELKIEVDINKLKKDIQEKTRECYEKLPESLAEFLLINAEHPIFKGIHVGNIILRSKSEANPKIESAESELVELLKNLEGPCLSYDTLSLMNQMRYVCNDSLEIVSKYGDIILNPQEWKKRLFRLDP